MSNSNEKGSTLVSQSQKDNKSVKIKKRHKKRKFFQISSQSNEVDDNKTQQVPQEIHSEEIKHQKKKRKRSKHQKNKETLSINWQEVRFDTAEAQLTHFWALYVQTLGEKLSVLELEDTLPSAEACFFKPKETKWDLSYLPTLILEILPEMSEFRCSNKIQSKSGENKGDSNEETKQKRTTLPLGQPLLIILTPSASRAIEISKVIKEFHVSEAPIANLFAKHKKIEEQRSFLQKRPINIAIGTPNRIDKLLKLEDSLSLSRTKFVLIDCFANVKGFTIFDMKETRMDLFNLYHDHLHKRVQSGQIRLVLF